MTDLNKILGIQGETLVKAESHVKIAVINAEKANINLDLSTKEKVKSYKFVGKIMALTLTTVGIIGTTIILAIII
jgi:cytoskeletal protein RodZ